MSLKASRVQTIRRMAACVAAPASPVLLVVIIRLHSILDGEYFNRPKDFQALWADYALFALVSAPASLLVWFVISGAKLPYRTWLIAPLFAVASAGSFALLGALENSSSLNVSYTLVGLFISLPISLTYCLIAGVPWRTPRGAAGLHPNAVAERQA
jgi:hypothetical protein